RALTSLLAQSEPLDEIVISINGGTDETATEVRRTLEEHGFAPGTCEPLLAFLASVQRWHGENASTRIVVIEHHEPMSKADSVNVAVLSKLATARRILVVDGDTVLDPGFVAGIKDNFYRFSVVRSRSADGRSSVTTFVVEDHALQSGAVRSQRPRGAGVAAHLVWLARTGEYAVSGVLRSGQTRRLGRRGPLARSRLFTVVGCGFVARSDTFPMPDDTRTEDHDFTLEVQNRDEVISRSSARALDQRGFRLVVDGRETSFSQHIGYDTEVTVRTGASARFVDESVMYTEDPRHTGGLIRQLERWNGGAVENAYKRLATPRHRARLRSNVRFAVGSALFENALGLSLVLVLPALLGFRHGFAWSENLLTGLGAWLAFDLVGCVALTLIGMHAARRHVSQGRGIEGGRVRSSRRPSTALLAATAAVVAVPLQLLRLVNAVSYVAAVSRTLPALTRGRSHAFEPRSESVPSTTASAVRRPSVTWERPAAVVTPAAYARTAGTALVLALVVMTVFSSTALVASSTVRPDRAAWRLTYAKHRVDMASHTLLPVVVTSVVSEPVDGRVTMFVGSDLTPARVPGARVTRGAGPLAPLEPGSGLSPFCSPNLLVGAENDRRLVQGAGVAGYKPLSPWGILVLARLAPLLSHLEEAASAYDVDADLLLRVLLNESYLDPLAVGPTEDLGLAQVTSDSLTLLRSVSSDRDSRFYNPSLIAPGFSVFDPAFSLCAGAAKLAWAVSEPGGASDEVAYARYINPLVGVVRGRVADTHVEAVAAMTALTPLTELLGSTISAYRADPSSVTDEERRLLEVATDVRSGRLDLAEAYRTTAALVVEMQVLDVDLYRAVLDRLYGELGSEADAGTILATLPEMKASNSSPSGP
ncbi:MAG TPA: transglycosylase SLT domain-containing protein, partial [Trueperaceae bacterium]|nr:transglycosylase SLT domain-containing protein [Trueperaceae bacterium]